MVRPVGPRIIARKKVGDTHPLTSAESAIPDVRKSAPAEVMSAVVTLAEWDAPDLIEMVTGYTVDELRVMREEIQNDHPS